MKNQQTWDFSQHYTAKEMIKIGAILAFLSIVGLWCKPCTGVTIMLALLLIIGPAVILITNVEGVIRRKFTMSMNKNIVSQSLVKTSPKPPAANLFKNGRQWFNVTYRLFT